MGFPRQLIAEHEKLVFELRPHWLALTGPAVWTLIALAAIITGTGFIAERGWGSPARQIFVAMVLLGWIALAAAPVLRWWFTLFVLTSDRLITRQGIVGKRSKEIPLERINDVAFSQTIFERVVGAGDLLIESAGERGQERITNVRNPEQVQLMIYKTAEENGNRMMRGGAAASAQSPGIPEQIAALARLKEQGVLSDDEFEAKKKDLLRRL